MAPDRSPLYTPEQLSYLHFHNRYVPLYLWIAILGIVGIAVGFNAGAKLASYVRRNHAARWIGKARPSARCSRTGKGCSRWVPGMLLAAFRKGCCRKSPLAERFGMSSLGELGVIGLYYLFNILLTVLGAYGNIDYMAHHAARLVYANMPIVIGLASKNNFISYATGFSYESLNVFHRWIARLTLLLSTVHVAGRLYINSPTIDFNGDPPPLDPRGYLYAGTVGYFLFFFMILGAARLMRNRFYQFFIITHVGSFIFGLVALSIHRPTLAPWLYAGLVVYFLDRILRTWRIVWHHTYNKVRERELPEGEAMGIVEALSEDTLRVTVRTTLNWIPGQHVYLHLPLLSAGGHPFSICSIDKPLQQIDDANAPISIAVLLIRVREGLTRRLFDLAMGDVESSMPSLSVSPTKRRWSSAPLEKKKSFANPASNYPTAALSPVWVEGAYGNLSHLDYYQTVLLVAGGSGVSFTLPLALDMVRRRRSMYLGTSEIAVATERLTFVWIIRDPKNVEWIGDSLREAVMLAPPGFLRVQIYVTAKGFVSTPTTAAQLSITSFLSPPPQQSSIPMVVPSRRKSLGVSERLAEATLPNDQSITSEKPALVDEIGDVPDDDATFVSNLFVNNSPKSTQLSTMEPAMQPIPDLSSLLIAGRPNLREILDGEIDATDFSDYTAVGTCGPSGMTTEMANVVSDAIQLDKVLRGEHRRNIRLHCEEFGW